MPWKTCVALVAVCALLCAAAEDAGSEATATGYYRSGDGYGQHEEYDGSTNHNNKHRHGQYVNPPATRPGLCAKAAECPYVKDQEALLSYLLFQATDSSRRISALEDAVFGSQAVPFNKTECLARGDFNSTFNTTTTSNWVVLNFQASREEATKICRGQLGQAPTCSAICGARGLKCDACGMMQTSCPSQLWQAMQWAGADMALLKAASDYYRTATGPPFADPDACPSSRNDTAGGPFITSNTAPNVAYAKSLGNARAVCDLEAGLAVVTNFYPSMKNMVDPSQTNNYLDPAKACDAPIWDTYTAASGQPITVHYSALCYCSGTL